MNKGELVGALELRLGGRAAASDAVEAFFDVVIREVAGGGKITIAGFGTFERVTRSARFGRQPRTGETVRIPALAVPKFKAGTVFRSVVAGGVEAREEGHVPQPPEVSDDTRVHPSIPAKPPLLGDATFVDSETSTVAEYETTPSTGTLARRAEGELVVRFEQYLRAMGHVVGRVRIRVPEETHSLVTDSYDTTTGILYEAKSSSDRGTVRLAVGQLLDYLRFVPEAKGALLLPEEPSEDLVKFIHSCGFGLSFAKSELWIHRDAPIKSQTPTPHAGVSSQATGSSTATAAKVARIHENSTKRAAGFGRNEHALAAEAKRQRSSKRRQKAALKRRATYPSKSLLPGSYVVPRITGVSVGLPSLGKRR